MRSRAQWRWSSSTRAQLSVSSTSTMWQCAARCRRRPFPPFLPIPRSTCPERRRVRIGRHPPDRHRVGRRDRSERLVMAVRRRSSNVHRRRLPPHRRLPPLLVPTPLLAPTRLLASTPNGRPAGDPSPAPDPRPGPILRTTPPGGGRSPTSHPKTSPLRSTTCLRPRLTNRGLRVSAARLVTHRGPVGPNRVGPNRVGPNPVGPNQVGPIRPGGRPQPQGDVAGRPTATRVGHRRRRWSPGRRRTVLVRPSSKCSGG